MTEAPERIWIENEFDDGDDDQWTYRAWEVRNYIGYDVEYVRKDTMQAQIDAAVKAERERCAKVAEHTRVDDTLSPTTRIAATIRKGDQP